jgi:hypothetical protein
MVHPTPTDPNLKPPGNLMVYTTWPDNHDDVDVWLLGPGMKVPIGYDHKNSENCDLIKDDQGTFKDSIGVNYENIFCRNLVDGEYIINVHAYKITTVPETVNIQVAMNVSGSMDILFNEQVTFSKPRDEITVVRFKIKDGKVVPGSVHHTFVSLYDMKGQA